MPWPPLRDRPSAADLVAAMPRRSTPTAPTPTHNPLPVPLPEPLEIGAEVRVRGETGTFKVAGTSRDHSVTCYSISGSGGARSFTPERVRPAKRRGASPDAALIEGGRRQHKRGPADDG